MPDLVTHGCVGLLLEWALARRRPAPLAAVFVAGSILPDLLSRVPGILLGHVDSKLLALPDTLLYAWEPLHQPVGLGIAAVGLALLFRPELRARVLLRLYLGMLLHLALDILQFHEGAGCMLVYPFWERPFEIGIVSSEASVWVAGPLLLACLLLGWRRGR